MTVPDQRWYRGDCHVHTQLSTGGELSPTQVRTEAFGLDFIAITEHNRVEPALPDIDDPDLAYLNDMLVIRGQEVVTADGHWLALGLPEGMLVDWDYQTREGGLQRCLDRVHAVGGLCIAAHPYAPYPGGAFTYGYDSFDAVEVWNGRWRGCDPWQADNEAALARWQALLAASADTRRWLPALANSDAHLRGQLRSPHNVVRAQALTVQGVLAGLRAGHSWLAESASVDLMATAEATQSDGRDDSLIRGGRNAATFGERLVTGGMPARVTVAALGVPSGVVTLLTDGGPEYRHTLPSNGSGTIRWIPPASNPRYVRIEVRHPDGRMAALSNPIFLSDEGE